MSGLLKEIKEFLGKWEETYNPNINISLEEMTTRYYPFRENGIEWLKHQQKLIEQQEILIHQLKGSLGYSVPGHINEHPDIINGIAEAMSNQITEKDREIEFLRMKIESLESTLQHYRGYQ